MLAFPRGCLPSRLSPGSLAPTCSKHTNRMNANSCTPLRSALCDDNESALEFLCRHDNYRGRKVEHKAVHAILVSWSRDSCQCHIRLRRDPWFPVFLKYIKIRISARSRTFSTLLYGFQSVPANPGSLWPATVPV